MKNPGSGYETALDPERPGHEDASGSDYIPKTEDTASQNAPLVSVIIASRNSAGTIVDCLKSITSQLYRPIEIIVVDSFSTDSTAEIARTMGAIVMLHNNGRSAQKNWGAKFAKGNYLYFVDSDFVIEPDLITSCIEAIQNADGVVIRNQDIAKGSRMSRLIASRRRILSYDPLNVAVRFVRKEVFDRLGGFDSDLYIAQDTDFHRRFLRAGFKMNYSQAREWHLGSPINLKDFLYGNLYYSPNLLKSTSRQPLFSLNRINPLHTISAWKHDDARSPDLLLVVFLGFLSNVTLLMGALLMLPAHEGRGGKARRADNA